MSTHSSELDRLIAHQGRNRLARMIACAGWLGFLQWCVVVLAVAVLSVLLVRRGDWLSAASCVVAPATLAYALRGRLVDWWPGTRHALNVLAAAIILSVIFRRSAPVLAAPEADLVRLAACSLHASIYFWTLSDRGLFPSK